ncbi:hypothetical protein ABPG72_021687 [Tetrahymena utriculariae]
MFQQPQYFAYNNNNNNYGNIGYYQQAQQQAMMDIYFLQQQQQLQQQQHQQLQNQKMVQNNNIFEDVSEEVEQFNVFGILDESMDLIEFEYNQKQSAKDNFEDEFSEGSTNNSSASSHNSSKILEVNFQSDDSSDSCQFSQEENNFSEHQINLYSGQGVHLFFDSNDRCAHSEEIILFGEEEVVVCINQQQIANYQNSNKNVRIVFMCPGKEVIVRRALSSYSDSEMMNSLPINMSSAALRFVASSEF